MAMAKIWRNRIEAGTQLFGNCPAKYRADVIGLIREDIEEGKRFTLNDLKGLVSSGKMTEAEYKEITGEDYDG